jgi:hypothetical protein
MLSLLENMSRDSWDYRYLNRVFKRFYLLFYYSFLGNNAFISIFGHGKVYITRVIGGYFYSPSFGGEPTDFFLVSLVDRYK